MVSLILLLLIELNVGSKSEIALTSSFERRKSEVVRKYLDTPFDGKET